MADPRFYDNCGPFQLAQICARASTPVPDDRSGESEVADLATLEGAGPGHLTFCVAKNPALGVAGSQADYCFVASGTDRESQRDRPFLIPCESVQHAFAAAAALFYPDHGLGSWTQAGAIHPSARLDENVRLAPGVVVGPGVEIGAGSRIGPNSVIGRGVAIGRDCEVGSQVTLAFSYVGDRVQILPGAQIGQPGFGFASSPRGHVKIPQLGRVIVQDDVEIGAGTTVDRGALGDTVIGEGTKIDNLTQIGHNTFLGRHCIIVAQTGISGSCELGNFVVLGGQVGISDHVRIGDFSRFAARSGAAPGEYPGGEDYGGVPARPIKLWRREVAAIALLARRRKRDPGE